MENNDKMEVMPPQPPITKGPPISDAFEFEIDTYINTPQMPKRKNYGIDRKKDKLVSNYLCELEDKPPIEYIAECLCNIFQYNNESEKDEGYFYDGMGRTFYESILHLFKGNKSNYCKLYKLQKEFECRSRNSKGDYAVFSSNHVTIDEMREFIHFFYQYFQENDDVYFNYFEFHYYYRSSLDEEQIPLLKEFIN